MYVPSGCQLSNFQRQFVVGLPEEGRELDDRSRFKVTLKLANTVDLDSIVDFCKKEKQTTQIANTVVSDSYGSGPHC